VSCAWRTTWGWTDCASPLPGNDLDIGSLELLEAALQGYSGTLLLVSHDRAFLDNVVTSVLAAEGEKARAKLSYKEQRVLEALPGEIEGELVGKLERWEELEGRTAVCQLN